jgi:hypothetical protein
MIRMRFVRFDKVMMKIKEDNGGFVLHTIYRLRTVAKTTAYSLRAPSYSSLQWYADGMKQLMY